MTYESIQKGKIREGDPTRDMLPHETPEEYRSATLADRESRADRMRAQTDKLKDEAEERRKKRAAMEAAQALALASMGMG